MQGPVPLVQFLGWADTMTAMLLVPAQIGPRVKSKIRMAELQMIIHITTGPRVSIFALCSLLIVGTETVMMVARFAVAHND